MVCICVISYLYNCLNILYNVINHPNVGFCDLKSLKDDTYVKRFSILYFKIMEPKKKRSQGFQKLRINSEIQFVTISTSIVTTENAPTSK